MVTRKPPKLVAARLRRSSTPRSGLNPMTRAAQARAARTVSLRQFEGMTFIAKIGIEKGGPKNDGTGENWPDKNMIAGDHAGQEGVAPGRAAPHRSTAETPEVRHLLHRQGPRCPSSGRGGRHEEAAHHRAGFAVRDWRISGSAMPPPLPSRPHVGSSKWTAPSHRARRSDD